MIRSPSGASVCCLLIAALVQSGVAQVEDDRLPGETQNFVVTARGGRRATEASTAGGRDLARAMALGGEVARGRAEDLRLQRLQQPHASAVQLPPAGGELPVDVQALNSIMPHLSPSDFQLARAAVSAAGRLLYAEGEGKAMGDDDGDDAEEYGEAADDEDTMHRDRQPEIREETASHHRISAKEHHFTYRQKVSGSTPIASLFLGTPPVSMDMILDTGSDKFVVKTWATIKTELDRLDAGLSAEVLPGPHIYDHNSSSSYVGLQMKEHGQDVPRQGFIAYGSGMALTQEGKETVHVGEKGRQLHAKDFPISEISVDSLQLLHSRHGLSGILGLQHMKNRSLGESLYSRLRDEGVMHAFGYCKGEDDQGTFIWGDRSSEGANLKVLGEIHWVVKISDIHARGPRHSKSDARSNSLERRKVTSDDDASSSSDGMDNLQFLRNAQVGGMVHRVIDRWDDGMDGRTDTAGVDDMFGPLKQIARAVEEFEHRSHQRHAEPGREQAEDVHLCARGKECVAVIDTGSNIIAMPTAAVRHLTSAINVAHDCSNMAQLPDIHFSLGDGVKISLPPSAYVMKVQLPDLKALRGDAGDSAVDGAGDSYSDGTVNEGGTVQDEAQAGDDTPLSAKEDDGDSYGYDEENEEKASGHSTVTIDEGGTSLDETGARNQHHNHNKKHRQGGARKTHRKHQNHGHHLSSASLQQRGKGELAAEAARRQVVESVLEEVLQRHGLDLRTALRGEDLLEVMQRSSTMCMPAFVPLDRETQFGSLVVVGSPLFEKYYTRWSWPKGGKQPQVFVKEKGDAEACAPEPASDEEAQGAAEDSSAAGSQEVQSVGKRRGSLLRSEREPSKMEESAGSVKKRTRPHRTRRPASAARLSEVPTEPQERSLEEIRYPHWAKGITSL